VRIDNKVVPFTLTHYRGEPRRIPQKGDPVRVVLSRKNRQLISVWAMN
jgi:hypothetical protein